MHVYQNLTNKPIYTMQQAHLHVYRRHCVGPSSTALSHATSIQGSMRAALSHALREHQHRRHVAPREVEEAARGDQLRGTS